MSGGVVRQERDASEYEEEIYARIRISAFLNLDGLRKGSIREFRARRPLTKAIFSGSFLIIQRYAKQQ
uniref:Uncharacterized protein n=1 Tax=Caenorhabditis tropicalis TaxID=1561998 RepID=A0A1I7T5T9_9PELO